VTGMSAEAHANGPEQMFPLLGEAGTKQEIA
jgi:hypothetical protein